MDKNFVEFIKQVDSMQKIVGDLDQIFYFVHPHVREMDDVKLILSFIGIIGEAEKRGIALGERTIAHLEGKINASG